jgi:hypothetical protein
MRLRSCWRRLRKRIYQSSNRIAHWANSQNTDQETADPTNSAVPITNNVVATPGHSDTYQKRQYRLDIRRYVRDSRDNKCRKKTELATLTAVVIYAGITLYLAIEAHYQLVYSERPWIGFNVDTLQPLKHGQTLRIKFDIINGGHSPALHELQFGYIRIYPTAAGWDCPAEAIKDLPTQCVGTKPKWADAKGGAMVLPNIPEIAVLESPTCDDSTVDILNTLNLNGRQNFYLIGCLNYFDEFHTARRTTFCEMYTGDKSIAPFAVANTGNATD